MDDRNGREKYGAKFNIIDAAVIALMAVIVFFSLRSAYITHFSKSSATTESLDFAFIITENTEYAGNIKVGDKIYVVAGNEYFGTVVKTASGEDEHMAVVRAVFEKDAELYKLGDVIISRGAETEIRASGFIGKAKCFKIDPVTDDGDSNVPGENEAGENTAEGGEDQN